MEVDTTEWDAICRICLQEGQLHSIFDYEDENAELNIAEKVMMCSSIEVFYKKHSSYHHLHMFFLF